MLESALTRPFRRRLAGGAAAALLLLSAEFCYRAALARPSRCADASDETGFDVYGVGESTAKGEPYPDAAALPRLVERAFGGRFQGRPIRAYFIAKESESIFPQAWAFERVMLCRPHGAPGAVLVYSGHNDAQYDVATPFFEYFREEILERSRLLRDLLYFIEKRFPGTRVRTLHTYERNMRLVVEQSLRAGLTPVLAAVASNVTGLDPGLLEPGEGDVDKEIARGEFLESAGRTEQALVYYRRLSDTSPALRGYLRYARARCLLRLGRRAQARALFRACIEAREPDNFGRATAQQNAIVRRLAREYSVPLVDADALFSAASRDGLPGGALFTDGHHPSLRGYALLGDAYARALARAYAAPTPRSLAGAPALAEAFGVTREQEENALLDSARWLFSVSLKHRYPYQRLRMAESGFRAALALEPGDFSPLLGAALVRAAVREARDGEDRGWMYLYPIFFGVRYDLDRAAWGRLSDDLRRHGASTEDLRGLAQAHARAERDEEARILIQRTQALTSAAVGRCRALLARFGVVPASDKAGGLLDRARSSLAQRDRALALLVQAEPLAARPAQKYEIALLYQELKEYARALAVLDRLTRDAPGNAGYLASRGVCEYLAGSSARAQASLKAAIRADPKSLSAYLTLGSIYAEQKRRRETVELYESALARTRDRPLDPLRRSVEQALLETRDGAAR